MIWISTFQGRFKYGSGFGPGLFFQNKMIGNAVCGFYCWKIFKIDLLGRVGELCTGMVHTQYTKCQHFIETNIMVSFLRCTDSVMNFHGFYDDA